MNVFDHLGQTYLAIDAAYAQSEAITTLKSAHRKKLYLNKKRQLNNQAYFLFMFSRLEDRIRSLSDKLIDTKTSSLSDWKSKHTWGIIARRKDRINLMERVALLTEIKGFDFQLIERYYKQRNSIGHGGDFTINISMPNVLADMKRLYKSLKS